MAAYMEEQIKAFLRRKHKQAPAGQPAKQTPPPPPPPPAQQRQQKEQEKSASRLSDFLSGIGLEKLDSVFAREEVDFESLQLLREEHYKDMGIKTVRTLLALALTLTLTLMMTPSLSLPLPLPLPLSLPLPLPLSLFVILQGPRLKILNALGRMHAKSEL